MATKILTAALVLLSLAGATVSAMALREHYKMESSPCSINEVWDCGIVNHSLFADFHGVPVAMIGIVGYALLGALAGRLPSVMIAAALCATAFALRLTWIEWKVLHAWCIYCVASQAIIIFILFLSIIQAVTSVRASNATQPR